MRIDITIPDSTRPSLKTRIAYVAQLLSETPELVEEIHIGEDSEDAAIQKMFTSERLAHIAKAQASIDEGKGMTMEQVREGLAETKAAWIAANPQ